ncbi:outer membrane protein assembly factor BamA [Gallibacterium anatis]|uniref:outer membrane protein assembly factor BamA n=1 Tax=Gallibacterium anatis TaxID=750 RepID=UPI000531FFA2|nr:outer membrane protein assembly factor BamA [Gallibacterium anatis]KGQ28189.1 outer membrane protein assembly protein YaeT [Gallibacterium anatis]
MKKLLLTTLLFSSTTTFAAPFVVKDIRIDGVAADNKPAVMAQLPVKVGQTITDRDIANVVRTLYLNGSFANVQASQEGNTLVVNVTERAVISSLEFSGNDSIPKDALQQNLDANNIKQGSLLNREKLDAFSTELVNYYHSIGFYNAKVHFNVDTVNGNQANVKLEIEEGDRALVKQINFVGNKSFDSDTLLEQMEIQPDVSWWNFFASSKLDQQKFQKDLQALKTFYLNHGYPKFNITDVKTDVSEDKKDINITIDVSEGDKYEVSGVRIVGDTAGLSDEMQPLLKKIYVGELFNGDNAKDVEDGIKNILGNHSYAAAQVNLVPEFDEANHKVNLTYVVDAGRRYYVRNILFKGNDASADKTLRQEMRQQEGALYSLSAIQQGKLRLERTGFFETVESSTEMVKGTNDQMDVIYKVKERNTGSINFGIGYGTESGLSYNASVKQDNFLGTGASASLSGTKNDYGMSIALGYNEPYFTKDGVSLGGSIFYDKYDNSKNDDQASYSKTSYGIDTTLGFPVDENNSYYLGLGYAHNKLKDIDPEYHRALYLESIEADSWEFSNDDFDFSLGWVYNSLNRGFFPTQGVKATIGGRVSIPGSDNKYYKLNANIIGYYPLNRANSWVVSGRAGINYANGFGGKKLPFYQYYTAGGIGSLRGFAYGSVGPNALYFNPKTCGNTAVIKNKINVDPDCYNIKDDDVVGGNVMGTASVELIMPTPFVSDKNQNSVRTSLFVDAASVWDTHWDKSFPLKGVPDYSDPSRIRASAGISFQWQSPIGPLVFSYAKPIKKYDGDDVEQFQFSIGGSF